MITKMELLLLVLVIVTGIFCSFKFEKINMNNAAMSIKTTTCIRGICAIVIFLDHLGLMLSIPFVLKPFTMVGYLCVSVFFSLADMDYGGDCPKTSGLTLCE